MKATNLLLIAFLSGTSVQAGSPVLELTDHQRGMTIAAPDIDWSLNANKYGTSLSNSKYRGARLSIQKSFRQRASNADAVNDRKAVMKRSLPGAKFINENEKLTIGGGTKAVGMTYNDPGKQVSAQELWFMHRGAQYHVKCRAKNEFFKVVKQECKKILATMKLF